jgi:hypothetical protein
MFKLYNKSQTAQLNWIRKHPVQWITLNVTLTVVFIGYIKYMDRREMRKIENEIDQQEK